MDFLRKGVEQYADLERRHVKLQKKYANMKSKYATEKSECDKVHRKKSVVNEERYLLEDTLESLQQELSDCKEEISELTCKLFEKEVMSGALETERNHMEHSLRLAESANQELKNEKEREYELLALAHQKATDMEYTLTNEVYDLKHAYEALLQKMKVLKHDKKKCEKENALLTSQKTKLATELDAERMNCRHLQACLDEVEMQIEKA